MKIDILEFPLEKDWSMCYWLAISTTKRGYDISTVHHKYPTSDWKYKMLRAKHSPIRRLMYAIHISDIPYYLSTHLVRHKIGYEVFVSTQRNDRQQAYDREAAPQGSLVDMTILCNAESIQTVLSKRLCNVVDKKMLPIAQEIKKKILEVTPEFKDLLNPPCVLYGKCFEIKSCGKVR